jgi:hypothetical protein
MMVVSIGRHLLTALPPQYLPLADAYGPGATVASDEYGVSGLQQATKPVETGQGGGRLD